MTDLVLHLLVFGAVACSMLLVPLTIGRLVRPRLPTPEKDAIYECGEPTIGSSYIQFDLRFYVVALLFIIFDVEVAFFFPWAMIFGGATQLADTRLTAETRTELTGRLLDAPVGSTASLTADAAQSLALVGLFDILAFFVVLLVGFAYVWWRGDLDWVRALTDPARRVRPVPATPAPLEAPGHGVITSNDPHPVH